MNNINEMLLFTTLGTISGALSKIVEDEGTKELLNQSRSACMLASLESKLRVDEEKDGTGKNV